mmetsp:Transcript_41305/g.62421  ORF Transcript_41305/g.62421 Transcript_41305/m.62421 type:complete len:83 (+) Transcript_41305:403-651(+)
MATFMVKNVEKALWKRLGKYEKKGDKRQHQKQAGSINTRQLYKKNKKQQKRETRACLPRSLRKQKAADYRHRFARRVLSLCN